MELCCKEIDLFISNPKEPIVKYNSIFREYYIKSFVNIITFEYCPWCGTKFPEILRDKFFDTLEAEYNIDTDIFECLNRPDLPPEFRTDEWWKKRGL